MYCFYISEVSSQ